MDFSEYKEFIQQIQIGKKLPDAIYLHISAKKYIPLLLYEYLESQIRELGVQNFEYNLFKFHKKDLKVTLLDYPQFFEDSYPALNQSCTLDLLLKKYRLSSYRTSDNPPILHRKETFLAPDHPKIPFFRELTQEGENAGLYKNTQTIGFQKSWERLIKKKGYELVDGRIVSKQKSSQPAEASKVRESIPSYETSVREIEVQRHKTALHRYGLSTPVQTLLNRGYLNGNHSFFDYGCGKGDDLRELRAHSIEASGWDPVYCPENPKKKADIVNLGFVLNVIEDPEERTRCLINAWDLTRKFLVVSVMIGSASTIEKFQRYKDGVITSRDTFQKYFSQQELRFYLETVLEVSPVAVAPGIFYVFADPLEEQTFLSNRQKRRAEWRMLSPRMKLAKAPVEKKSFYAINQALFDDYWSLCLELGRFPTTIEFDYSTKLKSIFGSVKKAREFLLEYHGKEIFQQARKDRKQDLIVYFALSQFERKKPYKRLPEGLKKDVKELFQDYPSVLKDSKELLFSVGKPEIIRKGCEYTFDQLNIGFLEENHHLQLHVSQIRDLPAVLRVYIGCATRLYGDVENTDLIKIHIQSSKVSLMKYDDFVKKPIPEMIQRIKINLRAQKIEFFDYGDHFPTQPLYLKSCAT